MERKDKGTWVGRVEEVVVKGKVGRGKPKKPEKLKDLWCLAADREAARDQAK